MRARFIALLIAIVVVVFLLLSCKKNQPRFEPRALRVYYRIKMVDKDGKATYSTVKSTTEYK